MRAEAEKVPAPEEKVNCRFAVWLFDMIARPAETIIGPKGVMAQVPLAEKSDPEMEQFAMPI